MLGRILVRSNTTSDIDTIQGYENQTFVRTIPRIQTAPYAPQAPRVTRELVSTSNGTDRLTGLLDLLARLGPYNQPEVAADRYHVASTLGQAGVANGAYCQPAGVNLTAADVAANASYNAAYKANLIDVGNNWVINKVACQVSTPPTQSARSVEQKDPTSLTLRQGDFYTNYACRAYRAIGGYLGLVQSENLFITNVNNNLTLPANSSFLFTFSGRPPIKSIGFWSLTVYGAQLYLVPNSLGRYEIGDRSPDLRFESGGLVFPNAGGNATGNATATPDGKFQILLQPADIPPPANWTGNWLPAPAGGGKLLYSIRFYAPAPAFTDGGYEFPVVETIPAIRS